jgi:class 3 adenylate cyclase
MPREVTEYVKTVGGYVASQVFGSGPPDILFITNWSTNLEVMWDEPSLVRFFDRLASLGRVILFDKRGTGVSDPVPLDSLPSAEEWMDDARGVLSAAGAEKVVLIGDTEGGIMAILFAATYPNLTSSLILSNAFARFLRASDYPFGLPSESVPKLLSLIEKSWGTGEMMNATAPGMAGDTRFRQWFARYQRLSMSPGAFVAMYRWVLEVDIRPVLAGINVPTLVLQRKENDYYRVGHGRYLGENIPNAKYVELPGTDVYPFHASDMNRVLDEIQEFLTGMRYDPKTDRMLTTIMFTDIVHSTDRAFAIGDMRWGDLLQAHHGLIRRHVEQNRGREIRSTGDGFLVTFDGPARAIRCALWISREVKNLGLEVRIGLHTGEVEIQGDAIEGIAVHLAARVMGKAEAGEVLVSRTVKDLVAGSGFVFEERGSHDLKGIPERWEIFAVYPVERDL